MITPILIYDDPVLRKTSVDISNDSFKLKKLINDMFETMYKADGAGLSAIQIGIPSRIFVVGMRGVFHYQRAFINPVIKKRFGLILEYVEGCLSFPTVYFPIKRQEKVELGWYDEKWQHHTEIFGGILSRVIQHEYDHLEGKLFIDRTNPTWREMSEISLELIAQRKVEIPYSYRK